MPAGPHHPTDLVDRHAAALRDSISAAVSHARPPRSKPAQKAPAKKRSARKHPARKTPTRKPGSGPVEGRTARCVACMAAAISGIARPMTTQPNQPRSDEADPESETTPAGVTGDLERKAEELGATTGPSRQSASGPRQPRRRDRRSESAGTQRTGVEPPARRRRRPDIEPNPDDG